MDTSGIHLQTQNCMQNTSWEWTGAPDQQKRIYRPMQNSVGWRIRGKSRSVSKIGLPLGGWGHRSRDPIPTSGQLSESEEKHLRLRGKQPKWNENQTALAAVIHTLDGIVAGSWSLGIGEQSQGKGCCWLWRDRSRECEEGDCGGKCLWRKVGSHGSRLMQLSHEWGR